MSKRAKGVIVMGSSELVERARGFAVAAHGGQKYGEHPYVYHLDAVAELVRPYGEEAEVVAYLHDVVEDAGVSVEKVREGFGDFVARCVGLVTDVAGANRAQRKLRTNEKLSKVRGRAEVALIVKAGDRLANLRESAKGSAEKLAMYRGEHAAFRVAVWREGLCQGLWDEMDALVES